MSEKELRPTWWHHGIYAKLLIFVLDVSAVELIEAQM
jgi:hypothetical protein